MCTRGSNRAAVAGPSTSPLGVGLLWRLANLKRHGSRGRWVPSLKRRRPPSHIRPKLDLGFRVTGQSVELFEIRPVWRGPLGEKRESAFAKATYVRTKGRWRVFWMRRDLKWHGYDPAPEVETVEEFVTLVQEDRYACFFG